MIESFCDTFYVILSLKTHATIKFIKLSHANIILLIKYCHNYSLSIKILLITRLAANYKLGIFDNLINNTNTVTKDENIM